MRYRRSHAKGASFFDQNQIFTMHTISEPIRLNCVHKPERGIWQRRYWEHQIRDDEDMRRHIDYIHYNPVKHGYFDLPIEWPHSSLHRYIQCDKLPKTWGMGMGYGGGVYGEV
ncbi:MAG: hypothetical protein ABUS47_01365 [Steroidobacter sp.]